MRNDQLTLKLKKSDEAGPGKPAKKKGKGRGKGRARGSTNKKASAENAVNTRAGAFRNKKRKHAKLAMKKARKVNEAAEGGEFEGEDLDEELSQKRPRNSVPAAALKPSAKPKRSPKAKPSPKGKAKASPKAETSPKPKPKASPKGKAKAKAKAAASKSKPETAVETACPESADKVEETVPTAVRGRRSLQDAEVGEGGDGFNYPHTFARRAAPNKVGSEAWHLWAISCRVFGDIIAPNIKDRSRTKKEAGTHTYCTHAYMVLEPCCLHTMLKYFCMPLVGRVLDLRPWFLG